MVLRAYMSIKRAAGIRIGRPFCKRERRLILSCCLGSLLHVRRTVLATDGNPPYHIYKTDHLGYDKKIVHKCKITRAQVTYVNRGDFSSRAVDLPTMMPTLCFVSTASDLLHGSGANITRTARARPTITLASHHIPLFAEFDSTKLPRIVLAVALPVPL